MATINSKLNETVELVKGKTSKPLVLSEQQKNEFKSFWFKLHGKKLQST